MKKAIVIGGGLSGLAAALTLSTEYDVHIFEKNAHLGGKMQRIDIDGFTFDFGPNTLTMPQYFWDVIAPFTDAKRVLPFQKVDAPTMHRVGQHEVVFTTDVAQMVTQLARIDTVSAQRYPAFIEEITRLFHLSEQTFLEKTFFSVKDYVSPTLGVRLLQAHPFQTLQQFLAHYFPHRDVQQLFGRFATYIGSSPYATPATFALIAYFELVEGTYMLTGGAPTIADVFTQLLKRQGVHVHTNEPIEKIATDGTHISFVETAKRRYGANIFISDIDYDYMQRQLGRPMPTHELSTSAYVTLIGLKEDVPLHYHNVLFSDHYEAEFRALRSGQYAVNATVYSCYPRALDHTRKPSLFVLINAPNDEAAPTYVQQQVDQALAAWGIKNQVAMRKALPPTFIRDTFAVRAGAIYGQASNTLKGSFFRPRNRDQHYKNLYYVGGTVHPGGGSPIVVKGGFEVAKRILNDN